MLNLAASSLAPGVFWPPSAWLRLFSSAMAFLQSSSSEGLSSTSFNRTKQARLTPSQTLSWKGMEPKQLLGSG
ncbi:hypothetical protein M5D96_013410 [Drosophila gunungcola]|uniref:Uncharacterized protein n=1 Tax=Drosophila gunungcola TaxID=103775 RepID=A0A9P9YBD5_9MUSC|nr:hypothetical protein M5D96_013410 [Drosophila gunungcola]